MDAGIREVGLRQTLEQAERAGSVLRATQLPLEPAELERRIGGVFHFGYKQGVGIVEAAAAGKQQSERLPRLLRVRRELAPQFGRLDTLLQGTALQREFRRAARQARIARLARELQIDRIGGAQLALLCREFRCHQLIQQRSGDWHFGKRFGVARFGARACRVGRRRGRGLRGCNGRRTCGRGTGLGRTRRAP